LKKRTVDLLPLAYDPSNYDVVVLGTPVWAGNMSSPLRSYVAAHKAQFRRVAFFCTQGGSGAEKVFHDLAELCGQPPVAALTVNGRELEQSAYSQRLERFATAVTSALRPEHSVNASQRPTAHTENVATAAPVRRAS
jgi:hypothetical protein